MWRDHRSAIRVSLTGDVFLRWGVSWTQGADQLLLHVANEGSSARTESGTELQDDSGN